MKVGDKSSQGGMALFEQRGSAVVAVVGAADGSVRGLCGRLSGKLSVVSLLHRGGRGAHD